MENVIARTGRVEEWLNNPESRLPVSCTVFVVEDTMEGPEGIEASWKFASHALRNGAGVAVHLSNLRPYGEENGKGLVASGPVSFGKIYSTINEILRRGGVYKNGACVLHLDIDHPDISDFVLATRAELPWVKRCVNVTQMRWDEASIKTKNEIIAGIKRGDIWLAKIRYDENGNRIYANVCLEVFLESRGTCLLEHINLGACEVKDIVPAFEKGMQELIDLHGKTDVGNSGEYLHPACDRQVGLGMLGLANLLAIEGITYAEFADALDHYLGRELPVPPATQEAITLVKTLSQGIHQAAQIARAGDMVRAFAIAPTASCSFRYTDRAGNTTAPEIAPPIGRVVDRDSSTFGVTQHSYGEVETAEKVGWDVYNRVANGIMKILQNTGLCHGYSYNTWSDMVHYSESFIQSWLRSPQTSMYYSLQVMQNTQAKDDIMNALDDSFRDLFDFDDISDNSDAIPNLSEYNDPSTCVACAE